MNSQVYEVSMKIIFALITNARMDMHIASLDLGSTIHAGSELRQL